MIDSHHHLWRYTAEEFDWLEGPLAPLRRDFLTEDLRAAAREAGVEGTVVVQARQTLEETAWLLEQAALCPLIRGVVGWAPLADRQFAGTLERLLASPLLRGLRHVVQGEADPEFLLRPEFNRGVAAMLGTGLVYDLLVLEKQLPVAARFVDRHPEQVFVLDHIAKPLIDAGAMEPWATNLIELARRPNVVCKVSGLVTEADPLEWTPSQLWPYLDKVVEAFGPRRLLAGSDWPVCLAGVSYGAWFRLLRDYFAAFSPSEQEAVFAGNATTVYSLVGAEGEPC